MLIELMKPWLMSAAIGAGCLVIGAAGGFVKGYNFANIAHYEAQIAALKKASEDKDRIAEQDRKAADEAMAKADTLEREITNVVNAKPSASAACVLSGDQLSWLRRIATSGH